MVSMCVVNYDLREGVFKLQDHEKSVMSPFQNMNVLTNLLRGQQRWHNALIISIGQKMFQVNTRITGNCLEEYPKSVKPVPVTKAIAAVNRGPRNDNLFVSTSARNEEASLSFVVACSSLEASPISSSTWDLDIDGDTNRYFDQQCEWRCHNLL